jgi:hypothetical protein
LKGATADAMSAGGEIDATAWATGVPDGSFVELLPGARIFYLETAAITNPETHVSSVGQKVVASAALSAKQNITTSRFAGPQPLLVGLAPVVTCPGVDATNVTWSTSPYLVGQWRIVTPDATVTTIDTGQFLNVY